MKISVHVKQNSLSYNKEIETIVNKVGQLISECIHICELLPLKLCLSFKSSTGPYPSLSIEYLFAAPRNTQSLIH